MALTSLAELGPGSRADDVRRLYGVASVTGTLPVQTGLKTIIKATATLGQDADLTVGSVVTVTLSDQGTDPGEMTIKVWKHTNSSTTTLIASTAAAVVYFDIVGLGPDG